jgi:hypothetical protein
MRILIALTVTLAVSAFACGGSKPKQESALVSEGQEQSPTCCCKTLPTSAEKEIIPNYEMKGRMECSAAHGDCVDDVQCNKPAGEEGTPGGNDGVPPPPALEPSTSSTP